MTALVWGIKPNVPLNKTAKLTKTAFKVLKTALLRNVYPSATKNEKY